MPEPTDDELTDLLSKVRRQVPERTDLPGAESQDDGWPDEVTESLRLLDRAVSERLRERSSVLAAVKTPHHG